METSHKSAGLAANISNSVLKFAPWIIFFTALSLRLLHLWAFHKTPLCLTLVGDSKEFDYYAWRIATDPAHCDLDIVLSPVYLVFLAGACEHREALLVPGVPGQRWPSLGRR